MFPIHKLNRRVTESLRKVVSADILGNIRNGLQNEIEFFDEGKGISNVAEIVDIPVFVGGKNRAKVRLSSAFCQFLWLFDDVALKSIDLRIIQKECESIDNFSIDEYRKVVVTIINNPELIPSTFDIDRKQYLDYLNRVIQLLDFHAYNRNIQLELSLAMSLLCKDKIVEDKHFDGICLDGKYEQLVNSAYIYGIDFILLHELNHFALNHLGNKERAQDEEDADSAAFWDIYSDLEGRERFSANVGILCSLFALLMLNPKLEEDNVHPREDVRIFSVYDQVCSDSIKYSVLLVELFSFWAVTYNISGFPKATDNLIDTVKLIRAFFDDYGRKP